MRSLTGGTRQFIRFQVIFTMLAMLVAGACSDSTGPDRTPTSIQLEATEFNLADAGTLEVTVAVLDQSGAAFDDLPSGTSITWTISDPEVVGLTVQADSRRVQLTGQQPGQAELTASAGELTASASVSVQQVAAELQIVSGDGQVWYAGEALEDSISVQVLDRHGNPVAGVEVEFSPADGAGSVGDATLSSDAQGIAATVWTLGELSGEYSLEVSVGDLTPVSFSATAVAVGTISGRVVAPNGTTPVPGAVVTLDSGDNGGVVVARLIPTAASALPIPTAVTDVDGRYTLDRVPEGTHTVVARRGLFVARMTVDVRANETTEVEPTVRSEKEMAYVPGSYDQIEAIVEESLGQDIERITRTQLSNPDITDRFGAIFLNCGASIMRSEAVIQNLLAFVEAGGLLYVSDLELPLVQAMFPDAVLEVGSGNTQTVIADVVDEALREGHLGGQDTVEIKFNLSGWQALMEISDQPNALLRGDIQIWGTTHEDRPLAIEFEHGEGRVVYTSFHNSAAATEDQIAVLEHYILGTAAIGAAAAEPGLLRLPRNLPTIDPTSAPAAEHRIRF